MKKASSCRESQDRPAGPLSLATSQQIFDSHFPPAPRAWHSPCDEASLPGGEMLFRGEEPCAQHASQSWGHLSSCPVPDPEVTCSVLTLLPRWDPHSAEDHRETCPSPGCAIRNKGQDGKIRRKPGGGDLGSPEAQGQSTEPGKHRLARVFSMTSGCSWGHDYY